MQRTHGVDVHSEYAMNLTLRVHEDRYGPLDLLASDAGNPGVRCEGH